MNNRDNLLGVLSAIYRWRKTIRNICLVTLAGSIVFSLLLKNYYQATTIFYPSSANLANPELIFGSSGEVIEYFGTDRDLDRLAEVANSNEVVDYMISRFHLYNHYGIDSTSKEGPNKVREMFRSLYSALKNRNDAIELNVEDVDRALSATMANAARERINFLLQRLVRGNQERLLVTFEDNIKYKEKELQRLADSLAYLMAYYHIVSVGDQGQQLSLQLATAESQVLRGQARLDVLKGNPAIPRDTIAYITANLRAYERLRENLLRQGNHRDGMSLQNFNEGSPKINVISDLHYQGRKQLSFDRERYMQIKAAFATTLSAVQVVDLAEPPRIKSRPKRSIIVLSAVLAAFLFSVIGVLLADAYRSVDWQEVRDGKRE